MSPATHADGHYPPMNDIKEYFTANKHPLIRRSARINQRLRATKGLDRPLYTTTSRRRERPSVAMAGRTDGRQPHTAETMQRHCPHGAHTRNLISIQQRRLLDCRDAAALLMLTASTSFLFIL